jgi:hypothetical protein
MVLDLEITLKYLEIFGHTQISPYLTYNIPTFDQNDLWNIGTSAT